jgi:hypothetical protein
LENRKLVAKRKDLRLQGGTGSKTGGYQSEKGDEKRELIVVATIISQMVGTPVFSDRTEFSVTTWHFQDLRQRPDDLSVRAGSRDPKDCGFESASSRAGLWLQRLQVDESRGATGEVAAGAICGIKPGNA